MSNKKRITGGAERAPSIDPAHAPGKRHLTLPHEQGRATPAAPVARMHSQPWVATSGRVGRSRRSGRGS